MCRLWHELSSSSTKLACWAELKGSERDHEPNTAKPNASEAKSMPATAKSRVHSGCQANSSQSAVGLKRLCQRGGYFGVTCKSAHFFAMPTLKACNMNPKPVSFSLSRRRMLQASMGSVLPWQLQVAAWAAQLPEAQDEVWQDTARARDIPVLLRWPAGRPQGVMVYSHGLGGKKEGGDVWGKAWADMGLLVLHLQHPGSDNIALKKGGLMALREASKPEQLMARMQDVRFAIAQINRRQASGGGSGYQNWGSVPVQKMAVGGHSFGARTTMLTAGWVRHGINGSDPQPKAFVAMSPALGNDVSVNKGRKELAAVTRPFLMCTGSLDGEIMGNGETPESRRMLYDALPAGKKALLWLNQADHFSFAGNDKKIPSTFLVRRTKESLSLEDVHHERVARISTDWLREQLLGQPMGAVTGLAAQDQWIRA